MPIVKRGRDLKDEDILDPSEMNEDLQPYVELLSGNVDAENISGADFKSNVTINQDAYYTPYYAQVICHPRFGVLNDKIIDGGVDQPNFVSTLANKRPSLGAFFKANVQVIPNASGWVALADGDDKAISGGSVGSVDAPFSITTGDTGESNLWVNATVQYVWNGFGFSGDEGSQFNGAEESVGQEYNAARIRFVPSVKDEALRPSRGGCHHLSMGFYSARVQFAIRVDGQVLEQTITGKRSEYETSPLGVKHTTTRSLSGSGANKNLPGPRGFERRAVGVGPEMMSVRLGTMIRVSPGAHKIEVVARRLAPRGQRTAIQRDRIGIHNRQLSVIELPVHDGSSIGLSNVSVPAFSSEDKLALGPRVGAVIDQANNMKRRHLKNGSLRNEHLPSRVLESAIVTINPDDTTNYTTAAFANENSSIWSNDDPFEATKIATARSGDVGWFLVTDSAKDFVVSSTVPVADDSLIIVMADLRLRTINVRTHADSIDRIPLENRLLDSFAGFAIGYSESTTNDTTWRIDPASRSYINSFNWVGRNAEFRIGPRSIGPGVMRSLGDFRNFPRSSAEQPNITDTFENVNVSLMWVIHGDRLREQNTSAGALRDIKRIGVFCSGAASPSGGANSGPHWESEAWQVSELSTDPAPYAIDTPKIKWGRGRMSLLHLKR